MASRIAGITIEIDGNTSKLQQAISDVNKTLKECDSNIRDIEKGLKLDPGNLTLWQQKQEAINTALDAAREKLDTLKTAQSQYTEGSDEWNNLQTEIGLTEAAISNYENKADEAAAMTAQLSGEVGDAGDSADDASGGMGDLATETDNAGKAAENANGGWTMAKQLLVDLAENAIQAAVDGMKKLGGAMKTAVTDSAAFADEVNTLAAQTHLSTDTIQELYYATDLMDVPVETVSKSLTKLTNTMSDATVEGSSAAEKFDALGISVKDNVTGELRDADDVFLDVIDALGQIDNEAERDAAAYDLFGRSAKELNPLIAMGSEGFAELQQEAHDAGAVMSGDMLDSLNGTQDAFDRMDQAVQVVQRNFAVALAPAISAVGEELTALSADADWQDVFSELGDAVAAILPDLLNMARQALPAIISILREVIPIVANIISYLPMLQPIIDALLMVLQRLSPIIGRLLSDLLPPLIDVIVAILPILEPILDILEPLLQILGPLLSAVLQALAVVLKALVQIITSSVQPVIRDLQKQVEKLAPVFQNVSAWLKNLNVDFKTIWANIQTAVSNAVNNVKNTVTNVFNAIKNTATSVWNGIKSAIMTPINAAVTGVQTAISKIKGFFSNLSLQLPRNIKLPHFTLTGSFSINPPRVPKLSISWYAKAMEEGMIFNTPTMFGFDGSHRMYAGEAGAEALIGVRSLRDMITSAVQGTANNNINVVVYGAPGQDVNALADVVADRIANKITRRGFAV